MAKAERRPRKRTTRTTRRRLPAEITLAVAAALDKKAENVVVLDLRKGLAFTDFFVIATGTNVRQVQTIADAIDEALRQKGARPAFVEGYDRAEWVLVDYFDFIVHVFLPATREFYGLERLWGDAERIEIPA
ncbi:MAG: ribosome silencing factor [Vicinamibacterales bacterium]